MSGERVITKAQLRYAALDFLARREHSRVELESKLARRFASEYLFCDLLSTTLDELENEGILSQSRYAAFLLRRLVSRGFGPARVKAELSSKGCNFDQALEEAYPDGFDWRSFACEIYNKKYHALEITGPWNEKQRERAKRARFMLQRGFEADHFMPLLGMW